VWVYGLLAHLRRKGYEASQVDSLKPRKYIHVGLVDWKLPVVAFRVGLALKLHVALGGTTQDSWAHLAMY